MKGQSLDLSTIICIGIGCNLSKDELFQLIRLGRICIDHPDDEYQKDYKYIIEHVYDENEKNKLFVINDYLVSRGYDCMFDC
ncbi:hypothetical protein [Aequitasia blattaphilus]|uniref:Uncharacterized protein n=1 Tax=Aequitasia blattaphilus TaxID=2949332 RepID=A0ABT1EBN1_9FIRM|nr:hypothetical protein [Aequitasia blattaphilus]MCP1103245.1 hypothetical protein [Aequitasia blattaphilus]MCR8615885.1 hypothetical protein [Aequitasia blattaphilus]